MSNIIVISGPSGSGKSTLIRQLLQKHPEIVFSASHTTRSKRNREIEGRDYYFVSRGQFQEMIDNGEFVEWAQVYGNYYGTSFREIEKKARSSSTKYLVLDIDVQGAKNIKAKYPDALFIFVVPPSFEELQKRLVGREKKVDAAVQKRLQIAEDELKQYFIYDYVIINDNLERSFHILNSIFVASRNRTSRRESFIKRLLNSRKTTADGYGGRR
jgi:guanylate kinase